MELLEKAKEADRKNEIRKKQIVAAEKEKMAHMFQVDLENFMNKEAKKAEI